MFSLPSITVVVPAHNAALFFEPAMRTIRAQEYSNLEVSIVDDGSEDNLAELAARDEGLRIRYFRQDNKGPAAARNVAIRNSNCDFIAFLDIDDLWTPGHLHRLSAALVANPEVGVAQGDIRNFICDPDGVSRWCSGQYRFFSFGASIYRRSVFDACGLFDEELRYGEDYDMAMRCFEGGVTKFAAGELSLLYRRHAHNMTNGQNLTSLGMARVYKKRLDRVRRGLYDPTAPSKVPLEDYLGLPPARYAGVREPLDQRELLAASGTPSGPKVSVVIPTYNSEEYLDQALQSILGQRYRPMEVLVVDDGSESPDVREVAEAFGPPVRVIRQQHLGAVAARNTGIAEATGEYLAFLDADDIWSPGKLQTQVEYLESHRAIDLVLGQIRNFHSPELSEEQRARFRSPLEAAEGWKQCAMLARRASFDRVGPLDDTLFTGDFSEWLNRARRIGLQIAHLPETHVYRRLHANNSGSGQKQAVQTSYLRLARQLMDQRRRKKLEDSAR